MCAGGKVKERVKGSDENTQGGRRREGRTANINTVVVTKLGFFVLIAHPQGSRGLSPRVSVTLENFFHCKCICSLCYTAGLRAYRYAWPMLCACPANILLTELHPQPLHPSCLMIPSPLPQSRFKSFEGIMSHLGG